MHLLWYLTSANLIFRQVKNPPRSENALAHRRDGDGLPAKKIRVNAQVTFVTSILEMICTFLTMIVVVIFRTATFPVIISIMITYLILLPCAFLMNTSHNKRRVIEHGWKNVLRNTFGLLPTPSNPVCNQPNKISGNKTSSRPKEKRSAVHPYERGQVHSQMISHDLDQSLPTGSTSTLVVASAEEASDCKGQTQKTPLEIIMRPEKLDRAYQSHRPKINLIVNVDNSVLECKANPATTRNCSENGKILVSDLEQESEFLFSCKWCKIRKKVFGYIWILVVFVIIM